LTDIFPIIQPEVEAPKAARLPLCREAAWDYERGIPVFSGGQPLEVTGAEAVKVWAWKALKTARRRFPAYTWGYGCEAERLIGKPFDEGVKRSEAARYVREALQINPYITGVRSVDVSFEGSALAIQCEISTVYGEVTVRV